MKMAETNREKLISYWTAEEDELLRKSYPDLPDEELGKLFSRSIEAIKGRAFRLNVRKSSRFVQEFLRQKTKERWKRLKGKARE